MAAPPNGRVGGGSSAPARTGGRVRSPAPASRPGAASGLSRPAPSSSPTVGPPASGRQTLAKRRTWTAADLSLCPSAWFRRCPRGRQLLRAMFFTTTLSPSTATGVFGRSPLHSVCVGEMFPVPEGMKGLGLVSMATGERGITLEILYPNSGNCNSCKKPPQMNPTRTKNTCS